MSIASRTLGGRLGFSLAGLVVTGCVGDDPYEAFLRRDSAQGGEDAGVESGAHEPVKLPRPDQISGSFLYVVSSKLAPKEPIVALMELEASGAGAGLDIRIRAQPLSASDRKTPVADFDPWRTVHADPSSSFTVDVGHISTPAAGNPINMSDVEANLTLTADPENLEYEDGDPDGLIVFWCGDAAGQITLPLPISLAGSTFTAQRIVEGQPYPPIYLNCDKDLADPPP